MKAQLVQDRLFTSPGRPTLWQPRNLVGPNVHLDNVLPPHAARTSGVRSCADSSPLATAIHLLPDWQRPNGARSRRAARIFQYVTEKAIRADKINGFLPARRRPFVDHSHVAGGAQRQGLQTCRPDADQPE